MSWFKTLKKTDKRSQHPPPLKIVSHADAGPSSISARLNQRVRSGGANDGNSSRITIHEGVATPLNNAKTSTHESRTLKSVLAAVSAIYAYCEVIAPVSTKVEDIISRIIALEELFGTPASDVAEQRRRGALIWNLREIEAKFQVLYGKPASQQFQDKGDIPKLLEDLREAISDYRMAQQRQLCAQEHTLINSDEATVLNSLPCSPGARIWRGREGCLKGTRGTVLDEIEFWTRNFSGPPVYWLNGPARTGKTVIAQTIAERTFADGQLGASFFCSRDLEDRSNLSLILPTLAIQLARKYADFRSSLIPLLQSHPGIAYESLYDQMQKLIVQPLQESNVHTVVIIDALDECKDEGPTSAILSVLAQLVSEIPGVKFLVTARPETFIQEGFRLPLLVEASDVFDLRKIEKSQMDNDIRLFFAHELSVVASPGRDRWLTKEELDTLCARAAGSFVYAVAAVKFIDKARWDSRKRIDLLLWSPGSPLLKTKIGLNEDEALDTFYALILQEAFGGRHDPDSDPKIRSVLSTVVLAADPLSPPAIATLLDLDIDDVLRLLSLTRPLLVPQKYINDHVIPFYKSFPGFITDPNRCNNKRFHISPSSHHPQLLMGCLNLMVRTLEGNVCQLPDGAANSDIGNLKQRIGQRINPALIYACRSWHVHLVDRHTTSADAPGITLAIHRFLENKFLFWLEVLSLLGDVMEAVDALQTAADWVEESPTLDLINDCSRFVVSYFEIISASSLHIYHSALLLTPESSIVRKLYEAHARPFTRVVRGVSPSWGSATLATVCPFRVELVVWSPCNRYLATSPSKSVTVAILDSTALRRLKSLEFRKRSSRPLALIFSPDSSMLTCSCIGQIQELFVVSWDIRTGCIVSAIEQRASNTRLDVKPLITYSTDGRMVGILYQYPNSAVISIYNVLSGACFYDVPHGVLGDPGGPRFYNIWTHGESIRFATAEPTTISVREVGFLVNSTPTQVATFPVLVNVHHTENFFLREDVTTRAQFLPTSHRLVLTRVSGSAYQILVWGPGDPEPKFIGTDSRFRPPVTLSSDGRFLACSGIGSEVYLWKESSTGYLLTARLPSSTRYSNSLLSPNGESIIVYGGSTIRLWRTNAFTTATAAPSSSPTPTTPSSSVSTQPQQTENFVLEFHSVRQLAAFARRKGRTVTILDLKSGLPHMTINAGVEILGIRVVDDIVVVVGDGEVFTWEITDFTTTTTTTTTPSPAIVSTRPYQTETFILEFHPVRPLAAFARRKGNTVTILDLNSGLPQLIINTGVEVHGTGMIEDTVVVVGDGKVITWKLPERDCLPGATIGPQDRARTIYLNDNLRDGVIAASISFDLSHVAFITQCILKHKRRLHVYRTSTGKRVGYALVKGNTLWFSPGRFDIWCADGNKAEVWTLIQNGLREPTHARTGAVDGGSLEAPWGPPRGYQVTQHGWILGPDGKRLLMLPPPLGLDAVEKVWKGQYLALLHWSLSEPVILELRP